MLDFFMNEFARLCRWRLSFPFVFPGALNDLLFWHLMENLLGWRKQSPFQLRQNFLKVMKRLLYGRGWWWGRNGTFPFKRARDHLLRSQSDGKRERKNDSSE